MDRARGAPKYRRRCEEDEGRKEDGRRGDEEKGRRGRRTRTRRVAGTESSFACNHIVADTRRTPMSTRTKSDVDDNKTNDTVLSTVETRLIPMGGERKGHDDMDVGWRLEHVVSRIKTLCD